MTTHLVNVLPLMVNTKNILIKCFEFASGVTRKIKDITKRVDDIELHYNVNDNIVEAFVNGEYHDCYPYQGGKDKDFLKLVLNTNKIDIISEIDYEDIDEES